MAKKFVSFLCCFILVIQISSVASAAQSTLQISVDGNLLSLTQSPIEVNGTIMAPIAPVFKQLGLSLTTTGNSLKGRKDGLIINMSKGSKIARVNGISVILKEPVSVVNNTFMAPLNFITDSLGAGLSSANGTILISNDYKQTMYNIDLPISVSGNYVSNLTGTDYLELIIVDFFYDPKAKKVNEYDYRSSIIGFDKKSTKKYNNYEVAKMTSDTNEIYIGSAVESLKKYSSYVSDDFDDSDDYVKSNMNYSKVKAYYKSKSYIDKIVALVKEEKDAQAAKLKKELQANKNKPLKVNDVSITYNSISVPEVNLEIKNLTTKTIVAYEMRVSCYDDFDRPVKRFLSSSNLYLGISQNNKIASGEYQTDTWTLNLYDLTTKVKNVTITAVKFSDGTSWKL
ncbi:stalk domain-containing protein [Cohnella abietis]|uniref:Copper amine oxidase-like N-terminal domain-containing protein n=1 Tax=Cohnella abietis TaxID=2507935 RepID=A0A3T1D5Q6_9BACL|nr:stalk domain-containing protein [Cohnella abietis]BBI33339.1 hypothetical protein KCTCHS21_27380 [Cohnella abietis]